MSPFIDNCLNWDTMWDRVCSFCVPWLSRATDSAWPLVLHHVCAPCRRPTPWWTRSSPAHIADTTVVNILHHFVCFSKDHKCFQVTHRPLFVRSKHEKVQEDFVNQRVFDHLFSALKQHGVWQNYNNPNRPIMAIAVHPFISHLHGRTLLFLSYFCAMGVRICFISSMMPFNLSGFPSTTFSMVLHTVD